MYEADSQMVEKIAREIKETKAMKKREDDMDKKLQEIAALMITNQIPIYPPQELLKTTRISGLFLKHSYCFRI